LEKQGYTDMARVQYQQAVNKALSPNLATYYERLGLMLQEENDHAEAIKAFKMALQFSARNMLNFHLAKSFDIYYQDSTSAKNQYELFLEREGEAESPERNFAEKRLAQIKKEAHFLAE
jgi:lipoprotein NlpI